jgi:hypothetical protein
MPGKRMLKSCQNTVYRKLVTMATAVAMSPTQTSKSADPTECSSATGDPIEVVFYTDPKTVEFEGWVFEVTEEPLEVELGGCDVVTLSFVTGGRALTTVFLTLNGEWVGTIEIDKSWRYVVMPGYDTLGFEVRTLGQKAPTRPDVVLKPVEEGPKA